MTENEIDAKEAARLLGISVAAVHRLCNRGTLPGRFFSGRRVIQRQSIDALKQSPVYQKRTRRRTFDELIEAGVVKQGVNGL